MQNTQLVKNKPYFEQSIINTLKKYLCSYHTLFKVWFIFNQMFISQEILYNTPIKRLFVQHFDINWTWHDVSSIDLQNLSIFQKVPCCNYQEKSL